MQNRVCTDAPTRGALATAMALAALASSPSSAHAERVGAALTAGGAPWSDVATTPASSSGAAASPAFSRAPRGVDAPVVPYGAVPDPAGTHVFVLPTARTLTAGDAMFTVGAGGPGLAGLRYGVTRRFDVGVAVPLYLTGVAVDARYAVVQQPSFALALWGYATTPVLPGVDPLQFAGFTFQGAGPAWMAGPIASVWGSRASFSAGAGLAQRTLVLGLWGFVQASLDVRIVDGVRALAGGLLLVEMAEESASGPRAVALVGNRHPRVLPYIVMGVRLHARRFAVDIGPLVALGGGTPLSTGSLGVWPWAAAAYVF